MQPGSEQIAELPTVVRIEGRPKKLPGRVQAKGQTRYGKLREPSQQDGQNYKSVRRSLSALVMTETELRLIAALAMIGDRRRPKNG